MKKILLSTALLSMMSAGHVLAGGEGPDGLKTEEEKKSTPSASGASLNSQTLEDLRKKCEAAQLKREALEAEGKAKEEAKRKAQEEAEKERKEAEEMAKLLAQLKVEEAQIKALEEKAAAELKAEEEKAKAAAADKAKLEEEARNKARGNVYQQHGRDFYVGNIDPNNSQYGQITEITEHGVKFFQQPEGCRGPGEYLTLNDTQWGERTEWVLKKGDTTFFPKGNVTMFPNEGPEAFKKKHKGQEWGSWNYQDTTKKSQAEKQRMNIKGHFGF